MRKIDGRRLTYFGRHVGPSTAGTSFATRFKEAQNLVNRLRDITIVSANKEEQEEYIGAQLKSLLNFNMLLEMMADVCEESRPQIANAALAGFEPVSKAAKVQLNRSVFRFQIESGELDELLAESPMELKCIPVPQ